MHPVRWMEDTIARSILGRMTQNAQLLSSAVSCDAVNNPPKEGIPRQGWDACADGAGCLLGGSRCVVSSSRHAEGTPWDAPPVSGAVKERPARSDVRVMAAPRGLIRAPPSRPSIGVKRRWWNESSCREYGRKAINADDARKSKKDDGG